MMADAIDTIVQFSGEDDWDTFVNHNSLNIEEETEFLEFCRGYGIDKNSGLSFLIEMFELWKLATTGVAY